MNRETGTSTTTGPWWPATSSSSFRAAPSAPRDYRTQPPENSFYPNKQFQFPCFEKTVQHLSAFQKVNTVCLQAGEPVRDGDGDAAAGPGCRHRLLYVAARAAVQRARGLVQQQDGRVPHQGSGQCWGSSTSMTRRLWKGKTEWNEQHIVGLGTGTQLSTSQYFRARDVL